MENVTVTAIASLQSHVAIAVAIIMSMGAIATGIGFALLGSKYIESSARQPEMMGPLQTKFFIIAALLDAIAMIGVVVALLFVFNNPFLSAIQQYLS